MVEENKETPYEEVKLPPISGKGGGNDIDKSEQMARELQAAYDHELSDDDEDEDEEN